MSDLARVLRKYARESNDGYLAGPAIEAADEIERLTAELARRDRNESRNCINWGPCSEHNNFMADITLEAKGTPNA